MERVTINLTDNDLVHVNALIDRIQSMTGVNVTKSKLCHDYLMNAVMKALEK